MSDSTQSTTQTGETTSPVPVLSYEPPERTFWSRLKRFVKRLGPAGPLAVLAGTFPPIGGFVLIGLISRLAPWLQANQGIGLVIVILGFATTAGLSLLPTYACSILTGYSFKFWVGFPAAMGAFVLGALIAYFVNGRAAGDRVMDIVKEHPKWEAVRVALLGAGFWKAFWIITLLRIPPTSPFAAANFIMGTIRAPLVPFVLGTLIGMAPRTAAVVWAAAHASTLDFSESKNVWSYVYLVGTTILVVAIIGRLANQAIQRATGERAAPAVSGQ